MTLYSRIIGAAIASTISAAALASDYDPPIVIEQAPEFVPVEIGNGWYLRGDIGHSFGTAANDPVNYRIYDGVAGTYTPAAFTSSDFDDNYTWGVGVGYTFNSWIRADATFEGQQNDFSGTTVTAAPCTGGPVGTTCRSENSATATTYSVMANLYGDLGTFVGVTPYIGAGAGASRVEWGNLTNTEYCVGGGCGAPPVLGTTTHAGESSWRFTYALMAGLAYDISRNLKVDLGYKYRWIDGGDMFNFDAASAAAGATGVQGKDEGFHQHEVKVGLRYSLW